MSQKQEKGKAKALETALRSTKLLGEQNRNTIPEKEEVRRLWYNLLDPTNTEKTKEDRLKTLKDTFRQFLARIEVPDRTLFETLERTGWGITNNMDLLVKDSIDLTEKSSVDIVFSNVSGKVIVAANMVSGLPYSVSVASYLRRKGAVVDFVLLTYSSRHSVTFKDGTKMEAKVYLPEIDYMKTRINETIILADDMVRTQNSMDATGDAIKQLGFKRIFRTTPGDVSLNLPLELWNGKVEVRSWNEKAWRWERQEVDSELLRDADGVFRNEMKFRFNKQE